MTTITTTIEALRNAFTTWDARYRADPEAFMNEAARLLDPKEDEWTYGAAATPYFLSILAELK